MNAKKLLFYLLAALLGGCIPVMSLHPLYTKEDVMFEEKLLGTWMDDPNNPETIWQFSNVNKQEKKYKFTFADKEGQKGLFVAHLVKLQNRLFMDVYPSEPPWNEEDPNKIEWSYNTLFFIPSHTFIKINGLRPKLKLQLTDDDELKKLLKENPNAIEHISTEDKLVLTASTQKLQAFVLKYADDDRLFTDENTLTRKKLKTQTLLSSKDPNDCSKEN